ncbi:hypothetical protein BFW38_07690 [Terasakiispira papahanaumokuakeensis]|uniref:Murein hydrolase transporter LrgA n=1 Tax=Terasakiispira papahanaumokuakeensis TaxID=197479 RepID=A0A1E2V8W3_9GAMM|nr:CidA/LrgA family protein [Terasakiispira papahanaumokuakeensis]ODC03448.1 hypothetical protein BFW38_07690 [Terasakiispira papahanaumokuakeensis]
MSLIKGFLQILLFLILGEGISFVFALPVTGNVIGMLLLCLFLLLRQQVGEGLRLASDKLISLLSLLLLPGGAGLFFLGDVMDGQWVGVLVSVLVGTLLSFISTLWLMQRLVRRPSEPQPPELQQES